MTIQAIGQTTNLYCNPRKDVAFGRKVLVDVPDDEYETPKKHKSEKKGDWGCAVASFFVTGLGQLCQGRVGAGLAQMGASILSGIGIFAGAKHESKALIGLSILGAFATSIYSIVDAYRGRNKEDED